MPECVVNASPRITLEVVGHIGLLQELFDGLIVPQGVAEEIGEGEANNPTRRWLEENGQHWIVRGGGIEPVIAGWDLGKGESEMLSWGYSHTGCVVILDDGVARKCAKALSLPCMGTLRILVRAKRRHLIPAVAPLLDAVQERGFRIHPDLVGEAKTIGWRVSPGNCGEPHPASHLPRL